MANTQMNIRIDEFLKARGDAAFANMGMTPTDVVRAVWEYAASHDDVPAILQAALSSPSKDFAQIESNYRVSLAQDAHGAVSRFRELAGIPGPSALDEIDYRELREQAWGIRLEELEHE